MFVRRGVLAALLSLPVLASAESKPLPDWQPGVAGDLAFQTSEFLKSTAFRNPDRVDVDLAPDGAFSKVNQDWDRTHQGKWFIEEQRYAFDAVVAGITYDRDDLIDRGQRILDWGFAQEQPDGGFDCPDSFHSASFFIEAAAHAALLIEASPHRAAHHSWVESIKPKLARAAHWMMDPNNEWKGRDHDVPYNHRDYLDADALGETGVLVGDKAMIERSDFYMREGLTRQNSSGFNPEKGGSDTSYQAVGMMFATTYYSIVANDAQRLALKIMIDKGLAWLKARIQPNGTIDQSGNTRTGPGPVRELGRNGTPKFMSYGSAYRAAYAWAMITRDPDWAEFAMSLAAGDRIERDQRARRRH